MPVDRSPVDFYDALAPGYDELFAAPHRRAYDDLAWQFVAPLLDAPARRVVDVGCGTGRWSARLVALGHRVLAVEPAAAMAAIATARIASPNFELIQASVEAADVPNACADMVVAMGSLQYTCDPVGAVQKVARWTRPGGWVAILVDSLVALVLELVRSGKPAEALERLNTRAGVWVLGNAQVRHHLFDRMRLETALRQAGLTEISVRGLLVGASAFGREAVTARLMAAPERQQRLERRLAEQPELANFGKQLLAIGRVPLER